MDKSSIAIITTVANFELYHKTSRYFPPEIQKYIIDGTKGMYGIDSINYMMRKLKDKNIKWLIMADEDVIFINNNIVFSIINYMEKENITVSGVRDGGVIAHRNQNPFVINTFFSILNFKEISAIWNKKEMLKNQYTKENEFDDDISNLKYNFDVNSLYEPYYCFFLWLRRKNKKIFFFNTHMHDDTITNAVIFNQKTFLYHTWYARSYNSNKRHTERINHILTLLADSSQKLNKSDTIYFKRKGFKIILLIRKLKSKIIQKLNK